MLARMVLPIVSDEPKYEDYEESYCGICKGSFSFDVKVAFNIVQDNSRHKDSTEVRKRAVRRYDERKRGRGPDRIESHASKEPSGSGP